MVQTGNPPKVSIEPTPFFFHWMHNIQSLYTGDVKPPVVLSNFSNRPNHDVEYEPDSLNANDCLINVACYDGQIQT